MEAPGNLVEVVGCPDELTVRVAIDLWNCRCLGAAALCQLDPLRLGDDRPNPSTHLAPAGQLSPPVPLRPLLGSQAC